MVCRGAERNCPFFLVVLGIGCGHIRVVGAYKSPARLCLSASVLATRIVQQSNREKIAKAATAATKRDAFCVVRATETCNYRQRIFNYTLSSEMGCCHRRRRWRREHQRKIPQTREQSKRNHAKAITAVSRWWWRWWRASGGSDIQGKANIIASRPFFRKPLINLTCALDSLYEWPFLPPFFPLLTASSILFLI